MAATVESLDETDIRLLENEEKEVEVLVDSVLKKVESEVLTECRVKGDQAPATVDDTHTSKKKTKLYKAKKMLCMERQIVTGAWLATDYPQEDVVREIHVCSDDVENKINAVKTCGDEETGDKLKPSEITVIKTKWTDPPKNAIHIKRQVRAFIQDVILKALEILKEENKHSELMTASDDKLLLRGYADDTLQNTPVLPTKFVIPTIRIDTVSDECLPEPDCIGDDVVDTIVNLILSQTLKRAEEEFKANEDAKNSTKVPVNGEILDEVKPSTGNLRLPPLSLSGETQGSRAPRRRQLTVKRLLGFKRRTYKLHPGNNGKMTHEAGHVPLVQHKLVTDDQDQAKQTETMVDKEEQAATTYVPNADADTPPKRTKAFSRRIFNRIFGSKQSYSPFRIMNKQIPSSENDGQI